MGKQQKLRIYIMSKRARLLVASQYPVSIQLIYTLLATSVFPIATCPIVLLLIQHWEICIEEIHAQFLFLYTCTGCVLVSTHTHPPPYIASWLVVAIACMRYVHIALHNVVSCHAGILVIFNIFNIFNIY